MSGDAALGPPTAHHYFVDEAGDLTLFDKRGREIVGQEGVSRAFMVGVAHLTDPSAVSTILQELRDLLLADPYFAGVPSMQPEGKKTARAFHAKDDLPEVRREVFAILGQIDTKVQVVVRRKHRMAEDARRVFERTGSKLSADAVYDAMSSRLFKNLLHKADENHITFARRGKSDRAEALSGMIGKAKRKFQQRWGVDYDKPTHIQSAYPHEVIGLQVVDYFLWALQRMYERGEDRFFNLVADRFKLIMDIDDTRHKPYGEWYSASHPLTIEKLKPLAD